MSYNNKWSDRRKASGPLKPRLFLLFEVLIYISILIIIHFAFKMPGLTLFGFFVLLFVFFSSSLVRYRKVLKRQKYSHYD